jgi:hypothetical protein
MKTIVINNKIKLVEDFTTIEVKVICPKANIQKMLETTKGKFISKNEINLNFNHNAGQVFEVTIKANFKNVEKFLRYQDVYNYRDVENFDSYIEMITINQYGFGGYAVSTKLCYENIVVALYAFGDCSRLSGNRNSYTRYYRKDGHSILRCNNDFTNFGEKRYIKTGKGWLSNKAY